MITPYKEEEVLGFYEERFLDEGDFDIDDIKDSLQDFLTNEEFKEIKGEADNKTKVQKLFFILIYHKKKLSDFLNILHNPYHWLAEGLKWALDTRTTHSNVVIDTYRRAIREIPKNDFIVHRCGFLWKIVKDLRALKREHYLVLHGKKGFGKKFLAADACKNYSVVRSMEHNIFWINASKCQSPEQDLDKLIRLKILLQDEDDSKTMSATNTSVKNEIVIVQKQIRRILEQTHYKNCLLVLVDVRRKETLKAFNLHCKIMITTRHTEILEDIPLENMKKININYGFLFNESDQMMAKALNRKEKTTYVYGDKIQNIHDVCNGHPFIMSMICKNFMDNPEESFERSIQRFDDWIGAIRTYKLDDNDFRIPIQETLKQLPEGYEDIYHSMVVFTDNVNVPVTVLKEYWGKSNHETEEIVKKFFKNSLLEYYYQATSPVTSMHYLYYTYLKNKLSMEFIKNCHMKLVESYKLESTIDNRKELDFDFPNDDYFHYYIAYHLKEAGMEDLMSQLYLDFGFLEQKLKYSRLPNTIGDLNAYENEIVGKCQKRRKFLNALIEFLPGTEEVIYKSSNTTLLQYALTSSNPLIKEHAIEAASKFPDRLWFYDIDHSAKQTQIIRTQHAPKFVKFYGHDAALIHMKDGTVSVQDLNVHYSNEPTLYRSDEYLVDLQVYNDVFFTLNEHGLLSAYQVLAPLEDSMSAHQHNSHKFDQPFNRSEPLYCYEEKISKITCFCLIDKRQYMDNEEVDIVVGLENGRIKVLRWTDRKTVVDQRRPIKSIVKDMKQIIFNYLGNHQLVMFMDKHGGIKFINLVDDREIPTTRPWQKHGKPVKVHPSNCPVSDSPIVVCVFKHRVVQIIFKENSMLGNILFTDFEIINDTQKDNEILSSALSEDSRLLILGTRKGIIVFERLRKQEILRSHLGEEILSIDIQSIDDVLYNSMLISVFNNSEEIINLHGIKRMDPSPDAHEIQWAPMEIDSQSSIVGDDEGAAGSSIGSTGDIFYRFLGDANLFDVWKEDNHVLSLVLVDDKNRIHFRDSKDEFGKTKKKVSFPHLITEICKHGQETFVGCQEGFVFQLGTGFPIAELDGSISYLESVMGKFVVAGTDIQYQILEIPKTFEGQLVKCFLMNEDLLICVKFDCSIDFVNTRTGGFFTRNVRNYTNCVTACYHDGILLLASSENQLFICEVSQETNGEIEIVTHNPNLEFMETAENLSNQITALAVSKDKGYYAVGYSKGLIELYNMSTKMLISRLESHKHKICCLKFSPWTDERAPIILVSLAEQIVFWSVNISLNNPRRSRLNSEKGIRRSQRFSRRLASTSESPDAVDSPGHSLINGFADDPWSPWNNKVGASDKPELLSCIKFVGNRAYKFYHNDNFTNFTTVDNDGTIYYLRLFETKGLTDHLEVKFENHLKI